MKIRFTTSVAGERFSFDHDEVATLPDAQAREFIRARQAVEVVEQAVAPAPETAIGRGARRARKSLGALFRG